jgi:hypothetical protein
MTTVEEDGFDVFKDADSVSAVLAFVYTTAGDEALRDLLTTIEADRESLKRYAGELAAIGLPAVADIVGKAAKDARSPISPHPEGSANGRDWDRRHRGIFRGYQITEDTAE